VNLVFLPKSGQLSSPRPKCGTHPLGGSGCRVELCFAATTAIEGITLSRPVILCIDDEDLGLEIRKMVLEREGFTVLTAHDGQSGISTFEAERVDAVIVDYAMPGMDGGLVAASLRQKNPHIPILMLSAYVALPEDVMRVISASATKGDGALALVDKLKELLQDKAPDEPGAAQ
jgi:CheY-like chemotaxis protein